MNYHEIDDVVAKLEAVERFVREIAAREDELATLGFRRMAAWSLYEEVDPILRDFDSLIGELLEFSRVVDRTTWESIKGIIDSSKLPDSLGRIYIRLKLEMERRRMPSRELMSAFRRAFAMFFGARSRHSLFSDVAMPIQEILVALHRLIPQVKKLARLYINKWQSDDEIFKPSNIDREVVIGHIETAVVIIQNASLAADDKKQLLEYLEHTKIELAETNPSWKKIVGALVIVAALLSGLADASQAYENVSKAIQHILGTSVERHLPRQLPALPDARGGVSR